MMSLYTSTKGQCPPYINDIVKFVKQNLQEPEAEPYTCKKIWLRNAGHMVEERNKDLWKNHFYRRLSNFSRGFYSVPWESYNAMGGDIVLDAGKLVTKTLDHALRSKELQNHSHLPQEWDDSMPPVESPTSQECRSNAVEKSSLARAGFRDILNAIHISRDRVGAVKAGLPYEEHVRLTEEKARGTEEQPDNDMVIMSLTDLYIPSLQHRKTKETEHEHHEHLVTPNVMQIPSSSVLTPRPSATLAWSEKVDRSSVHLSFDCRTSTPSTDSESENKIIRVSSGLTERNRRIGRDDREYLDCILQIIVCIRRMPTRDLRSKTPLNRETLRDLMRAYSGSDRDSKMTQMRFSRNYNNRMSMDTSFSGDTSSISQDGGRLSIVGGACKRRSRVGSVFGNISGLGRKRNSRMWERDYMKVETWEDLLALDDKLPAEGSPAAMTQNIISRTLKWSRRQSMLPIDNNEDRESTRKQPIWQQVAMEKAGNIFTEKKKQSKSEDACMVVARVRQNMAKLKYSLQREAEQELQRLERSRSVAFKFKMQCFDEMLPTSLFDTLCLRMQNVVDLISTDPDVDVQPSKWFEDLQERVHTRISQDDPEINEVLFKIGRFSQMGQKTVPYSKAKLCLLVMSLPAYDVCKISTQKALKFVMEKILVGEESQLQSWLSQRKLPWVIVK